MGTGASPHAVLEDLLSHAPRQKLSCSSFQRGFMKINPMRAHNTFTDCVITFGDAEMLLRATLSCTSRSLRYNFGVNSESIRQKSGDAEMLLRATLSYTSHSLRYNFGANSGSIRQKSGDAEMLLRATLSYTSHSLRYNVGVNSPKE